MTLRPTDYAALSQDSYKDPVLNQSIKIGGVEYMSSPDWFFDLPLNSSGLSVCQVRIA